jgi:archaellum component FlaF (FlaF/FlaG flagellin family)
MFQFGWHRIYFTHSPEKHFALSSDIENSVFDKYSVNGTRFIFLTELYDYESSWEERNIAGGEFYLKIFTKLEGSVTYRLLKTTINTSSFSMDIYDMKKGEAVLDSSKTTNRADGYKADYMRSKEYKFPCPKDMKYSITVFIEEEKDGLKTVYEFTYYYFLEKKDRWIKLIP